MQEGPGTRVPGPSCFNVQMTTPQYAPQPFSPADEKLWATLIHLSAFIIGFWGPLIGYLVLKERGAFVRQHVTEALNFHISVTIYGVAIGILSLPTFGLAAFLYLPLGILVIVFMIQAAIAANRWAYYRYPLSIRLVK